jgi:predicted transcriptional regulator
MKRERSTSDLGRRERQILDTVFRLGEASVADVLNSLPDPPSYDSVRTMIRLLESKGFLRHRRMGARYIYRPVDSREKASKSALSHLMKTFFQGSAADTVAAILDHSAVELSEDDLDRLEQLIDQARKEGR